jgi:hypothetical protein
LVALEFWENELILVADRLTKGLSSPGYGVFGSSDGRQEHAFVAGVPIGVFGDWNFLIAANDHSLWGEIGFELMVSGSWRGADQCEPGSFTSDELIEEDIFDKVAWLFHIPDLVKGAGVKKGTAQKVTVLVVDADDIEGAWGRALRPEWIREDMGMPLSFREKLGGA